MAQKLTPDSEYMAGTVKVKVKKIPFGTVWTKDCCGFTKGSLYKADRLMSGGTGVIKGITIHNTDDSADAETYTRATFNQNMETARVHFYVDAKEAWQNLELNEVGWHAGTGDRSYGNDSTLAIEIIMGASYNEKDKKSEANGAMLTAYLLRKTGLTIDSVTTHKHWSGKECPLRILGHWDAFLAQVKKALDTLDAEAAKAAAKLVDEEAAEREKPEKDNLPDDYAKSAVEAAVAKKILRGGIDGSLRLHDFLTRQDAMVILERAGVLSETE